MPENEKRYLAGLEQELAYAEQRGDAAQAKAVKAQIGRIRKSLKSAGAVETSAATPPETASQPDGNEADDLKCGDCDREFKNIGGLSSHRRAKHGDG